MKEINYSQLTAKNANKKTLTTRTVQHSSIAELLGQAGMVIDPHPWGRVRCAAGGSGLIAASCHRIRYTLHHVKRHANLDSALGRWKCSLPDSFRWTDDSQPVPLMNTGNQGKMYILAFQCREWCMLK